MPQRTLANYRTYISQVLGLDNTASSGDQTFIDAMVNEGVERFVMDTDIFSDIDTVDLTSGTSNYTLPTGIIKVIDCYNTVSNLVYTVEKIPIHEMNTLRMGTASIAPARFLSLIGTNIISVYPTPGTGETLTLFYVPRPATLSASGSSPDEIPYEYQTAPEFWALWRCANYDDDSSSQQGLLYRAEYDRMVREARKYKSKKWGSRLGRAIVNGRPGLMTPRDRSQDITGW